MREFCKVNEPTLSAGSKEQVYITSVTSSENFFCQLAKTSTQLDDLMNQIQEFYRPLGKDEEAFNYPKIGEACCAMFTEDDGWYRAVVTKVTGQTVEVCYLDYGNCEQIPLYRVKRMLPCFAEPDAHGFKASLTCGDGDVVGSSQFSAAVGEKELVVKVTGRNDSGVYQVQVYEVNGTCIRLFCPEQTEGKGDTSVTIKGIVDI